MELIKIEKSKGGKEVVSARELHKFLEVETKFGDWILRMIPYGFKENIDYSKMSTDNQQYNFDFALTLEMAKNVSMIQRSESGMRARKYFIECEKRLNAPVQIAPKTRLELARENLALIEEIESKDALLLEQAPKVEYFDTVTQSEDEVSIGESSKILNLGYGSITLFKKLRSANVLMHDNITYQTYVDRGWFRVVQNRYPKNDGTWGISPKTVVYQKGLDGIRKLLSK